MGKGAGTQNSSDLPLPATMMVPTADSTLPHRFPSENPATPVSPALNPTLPASSQGETNTQGKGHRMGTRCLRPLQPLRSRPDDAALPSVTRRGEPWGLCAALRRQGPDHLSCCQGSCVLRLPAFSLGARFFPNHNKEGRQFS